MYEDYLGKFHIIYFFFDVLFIVCQLNKRTSLTSLFSFLGQVTSLILFSLISTISVFIEHVVISHLGVPAR